MIDWMSLKEDDEKIIREIMKRVHIMLPGLNHSEVQMDIEAAHITTPLDLETLAASKNQHFLHDIQGIRRHINRHTGELQEGFAPRCGTKEYMFPGKWGLEYSRLEQSRFKTRKG